MFARPPAARWIRPWSRLRYSLLGCMWSIAPFEPEMLPVGIMVHIVNHALGYLEGPTPEDPRPRFVHYEQAEDLHTLFRDTLVAQVPAYRKPGMETAFALSATIGLFLWHGFTWDIDGGERVLRKEDSEELALLEGLLAVPLPRR